MIYTKAFLLYEGSLGSVFGRTRAHAYLFFFFFYMNGNTQRAQCALLESASLKKRKRKAMKRIKQIYKISKKCNKKNSHLVGGDRPAFWRKEGWRKPEIQKKGESYKAGSGREETITELINYRCIHSPSFCFLSYCLCTFDWDTARLCSYRRKVLKTKPSV